MKKKNRYEIDNLIKRIKNEAERWRGRTINENLWKWLISKTPDVKENWIREYFTATKVFFASAFLLLLLLSALSIFFHRSGSLHCIQSQYIVWHSVCHLMLSLRQFTITIKNMMLFSHHHCALFVFLFFTLNIRRMVMLSQNICGRKHRKISFSSFLCINWNAFSD